MKAHKYIFLFLSYLTISPLLLILDRKWNLLPKWLKITLFVVSPFMLLLLLIALASIDWAMSKYTHEYRFTSNKAIMEMTGICFPTYIMTECKKERSSICNSYILKFEFVEMPDSNFFQKLEENKDMYELDYQGNMCFSKDYYYWAIVSYFGNRGPKINGTAILMVNKNSPVFEINLVEFNYYLFPGKSH